MDVKAVKTDQYSVKILPKYIFRVFKGSLIFVLFINSQICPEDENLCMGNCMFKFDKALGLTKKIY